MSTKISQEKNVPFYNFGLWIMSFFSPVKWYALPSPGQAKCFCVSAVCNFECVAKCGLSQMFAIAGNQELFQVLRFVCILILKRSTWMLKNKTLIRLLVENWFFCFKKSKGEAHRTNISRHSAVSLAILYSFVNLQVKFKVMLKVHRKTIIAPSITIVETLLSTCGK